MPTDTFFRLRDEKQEVILRAAIREFVEKGFDRAKVSDIAQSAGVSKGSIYQYFADKEELYLYCAQWGIHLFMEKLDARMPLESQDVFSYFADRVSKSLVLEEERELALFMQSMAGEPLLMEKTFHHMYEKTNDYIVNLLENTRAKGLLRRDIEDELLVEYFIAVTDRFQRRWMARYIDFSREMTPAETQAMERELEQMLTLLKNGMGC